MMPAGRYYIGDLCYVMNDVEWDEFCGITIQQNECVDGEFQFKDGRRFATYGTKWGDGEYRDQQGRRYSVDAGLIGCIRVEDIRANKYGDIESLGSIVEFQADFFTAGGRRDDGVIKFGDLVAIDTDPEECFDEEDYEESEY